MSKFYDVFRIQSLFGTLYKQKIINPFGEQNAALIFRVLIHPTSIKMIYTFIDENFIMNECIENERIAAKESKELIECELNEEGKFVERKLYEEGKKKEENEANAFGDNLTGDILPIDNLTDAQLIGLFVDDFHQPCLANEFMSSVEALSADRFSGKVTFSLTANTIFEEEEELYEELMEYRRSGYLHVEARLTAGQVIRRRWRVLGEQSGECSSGRTGGRFLGEGKPLQ